MPVKTFDSLPAVSELRAENIIINNSVDPSSSRHDESLKIGILNLMPLKSMTETDFLRLLASSPFNIEVNWVETSSYRGTHTPAAHLDSFYVKWEDVKDRKYDGFIITGAPVEEIEFEEVAYWEELVKIMNWCRTNVRSTLYICWGAQAGLYHHYGVRKYRLPEKMSGVFSHRVLEPSLPLVRGLDDSFFVPHSRNTEIRRADIENNPSLKLVTISDRAGVHCVMASDGVEIFLTGHSEYSPGTLDFEYHRDMQKGLNPRIPENYYVNDDPSMAINVTWRSTAHLLFNNWINYYVSGFTTTHLAK